MHSANNGPGGADEMKSDRARLESTAATVTSDVHTGMTHLYNNFSEMNRRLATICATLYRHVEQHHAVELYYDTKVPGSERILDAPFGIAVTVDGDDRVMRVLQHNRKDCRRIEMYKLRSQSTRFVYCKELSFPVRKHNDTSSCATKQRCGVSLTSCRNRVYFLNREFSHIHVICNGVSTSPTKIDVTSMSLSLPAGLAVRDEDGADTRLAIFDADTCEVVYATVNATGGLSFVGRVKIGSERASAAPDVSAGNVAFDNTGLLYAFANGCLFRVDIGSSPASVEHLSIIDQRSSLPTNAGIVCYEPGELLIAEVSTDADVSQVVCIRVDDMSATRSFHVPVRLTGHMAVCGPAAVYASVVSSKKQSGGVLINLFACRE
jgi:hypothetical protein